MHALVSGYILINKVLLSKLLNGPCKTVKYDARAMHQSKLA